MSARRRGIAALVDNDDVAAARTKKVDFKPEWASDQSLAPPEASGSAR